MGIPEPDHLAAAYRVLKDQGNVTGQQRTAKQLAALGRGTDGKPAREAAAAQRAAAHEPPAPRTGDKPGKPEDKPEDKPAGRAELPHGRTSPPGRQART